MADQPQLDHRAGILDRKPVHVRDILSDEGNEFPDGQELSRRVGSKGVRSILAVPLLREGESIGAILLRRPRSKSLQGQTDQFAADFRRSGRDRYRQCAPVR